MADLAATRAGPEAGGTTPLPRPRLPRHLVVAGTSWLSRVVSAAVQLVSVRLLLDGLGLQDYAVFALLAGLQGWFLLADFGVGYSAQNHFSEARARGDDVEDVVRAARLLALVLLAVTVPALYLCSPWLGPMLLKAFPWLPDAERARLFFVTGALSIGFAVGGIIYKLWYAQQRGYLANIVPAIAAVVGLAGVTMAGRVALESRLLFSVVAFIAPTAVLPLGVLAVQMLRGCTPRPAAALPLRPILRRAVGFWCFALMGAITLQIDYVVLSQALGPREIATYSLMTKVFGLVFFVYTALILALWPVFTEMITLHRWAEVAAYLRKYITIGLAFVAACTVALVWAMPVAFRLLAPGQVIAAPVALVLLMGVYWMARVWTDTFSMLLQSVNRIRPFLLLVPVQAVLSGGLQWVLAPRLGLTGIVLGLLASFLLTVAWGLPLAALRVFRGSKAFGS